MLPWENSWVCMRRPQGSQIGIGFHHLWYEWALLLTCNNVYQISDMYPTSFLHVHRYRNDGKVHLSTSKLRTKDCLYIKEDERGALLFQFQNKTYAYRSAHFGAKTSAWHWGRVRGALLRLLHKFMYFRHAAWVMWTTFSSSFPTKQHQCI